MSRDYRIYLLDILEAIDLIRKFIGGESQMEFLVDQKTRTATTLRSFPAPMRIGWPVSSLHTYMSNLGAMILCLESFE